MYRVLIWGNGQTIYMPVDGYRFIPVGEITPDAFDYVAVASKEHYADICKTAVELGINAGMINHNRILR